MSQSKNRVIQINKSVNLGMMPVFLSMMQRHLEKEQPVGVKAGSGVDYQLPVDLLSLSIDDKALLKDIADVTFTYRSKS